MHRIYGLWHGSNFAVRPAADKNFYLRLTVEKMHAFPVFNGTAGIKCTNSKTEIQSEIVETQIIGIKIDVVLK